VSGTPLTVRTMSDSFDRGGKVQTVIVDNRRKRPFQPEIKDRVEAGSALYTETIPI
jgi:transposase-like protein